MLLGFLFMKTSTNNQAQQKINHGAAFRMGDNVLEKWDCSPAEKQAILGLSKACYYRFQNDNDKSKFSNDQLERLSYIANIHQSLRIVFSNPDNVYGFMGMKNDNPYFNGRTPLSLIATGNFGTLYEVFKRIDAMRNGQW